MVRRRSAVRSRKTAPGSIPKRSTGADCKSAGLCLRRFESFSAHHKTHLMRGVFCFWIKKSRPIPLWNGRGTHRRAGEREVKLQRDSQERGFVGVATQSRDLLCPVQRQGSDFDCNSEHHNLVAILWKARH